ncbi:MAG: hypothetical protein Q9169_007791 [Polycauliona sp. 2 TL-2023]
MPVNVPRCSVGALAAMLATSTLSVRRSFSHGHPGLIDSAPSFHSIGVSFSDTQAGVAGVVHKGRCRTKYQSDARAMFAQAPYIGVLSLCSRCFSVFISSIIIHAQATANPSHNTFFEDIISFPAQRSIRVHSISYHNIMPAQQYVRCGPSDDWDLAHEDADILLCTKLPPFTLAKWRIIFTIQNAGKILQYQWTTIKPQWNPSRSPVALQNLDGTAYLDRWNNLKNSVDPGKRDDKRQSRACDEFKRGLQPAMQPAFHVIRLDRIPSAAIKRLCVGLRKGYQPQEIANSLEKLVKDGLLEKNKNKEIGPYEVQCMQLYLCASDNEDYDKWMSIDTNDPAFRSEVAAIEVAN